MGRAPVDTHTRGGQALLNPSSGSHTRAHSQIQPAAMHSGVPGRPTPRRYAAHLLLLCAHEPTDILTDNKLTTAPKRKPEPYRGAQEGGLRDHLQPLSPHGSYPMGRGSSWGRVGRECAGQWEQLWSESGGGGWGWISRENKKVPTNINKCVAS